MSQWEKINIQLDNGEMAEAQTPIILSVSRSTDVPAFYSDWFFQRLKDGYSAWINPFNGSKSYISYAKTRFIVFWSKNPYPLLKHIEELKKMDINCYIQYSLNDYVKECLEPNVPNVEMRIKTFQDLVKVLGFGHVVWRFDPLILTENIGLEQLLHKITYIGDQLKGYTEKLVFSFVDIMLYKNVKKNLMNDNVHYEEWTEPLMKEFAKRLSEINRSHGWNYTLATCAESIPLEEYGIEHNKCIDDDLMIRLAFDDKNLMKFLGVEIISTQPSLFDDITFPNNAIKINDTTYAIKNKNNKDKGQRQFCGCIISKDIGQYNTCPHQCKYCYANANRLSAMANYKKHQKNPFSEMIIGK